MKKLFMVLFLALCSLTTQPLQANTRFKSLTALCKLPIISPQSPSSPQERLITLHGRVVDARTGEPVAKVKVIASGTDQSATTDENGAFTLEKLLLGQVELYITTVNSGF